MAHSLDPGKARGRGTWISDFHASLVYNKEFQVSQGVLAGFVERTKYKNIYSQVKKNHWGRKALGSVLTWGWGWGHYCMP